MNETFKNIIVWMTLLLMVASLFNNFGVNNHAVEEISYSTFLHKVERGEVREVSVIDNRIIEGKTVDMVSFSTYMPMPDWDLVSFLQSKNVDFVGKPPEKQGLLYSLLINTLPGLLLFGFIWYMLIKQMSGMGGRGAMSFGKSRARIIGEDDIKVNFDDVAGCDEAKEEVKELVDYLRDPAKFQLLGGKIPKGVLMVGRPGTGKTLLARAIAGEAKVPFLSLSGSDFVEMFVGVGASRVRDTFDQAKKNAPCIIFIDEIDAVGRQRGANVGGSNDEREQTLNQLLVEMDGFEGKESVIVIAATNRADVLDKALLRPGRFDRRVVVDLPDIKGRSAIMKIHTKRMPLENDVNINIIARGTPGFSGADLANLVNEAALLAARDDKKSISMMYFDKARDKVMMGSEKKSRVMSDKERTNTAYHEAGHAIVSYFLPDHDPVYKVTIIPRAQALGVTMYIPDEDRLSHSRANLESSICTLFGGRIAEELIFGEDAVTTGASNDIERATSIAKRMVTEWGLSNKVGPLNFAEDDQSSFKSRPISDTTADLIDTEVKGIIDKNYQKAENILNDNINKLHNMANALLKYETINSDQVEDIMQNRSIRESAEFSRSLSSDKDSDNKSDKNNDDIKNDVIN